MTMNIPTELTKLNQWVNWGVNPDNPKMPYCPRDLRIPAKAGDPTTWGSYQDALTQCAVGSAKGIGFEFNGSGYIGIDLDHCRNADTGELKSWAQRIVDDFDSYTEVSMSGTGVHIFIRGKKPGGQCKKTLDKATGEAIEIYEDGRYFAMTASGKQVLGRDTKQCDTLYLSLEDGKRQLQSRARMVLEAKGIDPPRNFYLATAANPVDMGLIEQLAAQLEAHPNIKLIVIDILNRIRASTRSFGKNAYEIDSAEMSKLKDFTNKYNICVLIVHHNRKGRDTQAPFQNISGSQGLLGGVDEGLMLVRAPRPSREARLSVTSRDMEDVELTIYLDDKTCVWRDISDQKANDERAEYEDNPVVKVIKAVLDKAVDKSWLGTATDLLESGKRLGISVDLTAQGVGYELRELGARLYDYSNIVYAPIGNGTAPKKHHFYYLNLGPYEDDGLDENDDYEDGDVN